MQNLDIGDPAEFRYFETQTRSLDLKGLVVLYYENCPEVNEKIKRLQDNEALHFGTHAVIKGPKTDSLI